MPSPYFTDGFSCGSRSMLHWRQPPCREMASMLMLTSTSEEALRSRASRTPVICSLETADTPNGSMKVKTGLPSTCSQTVSRCSAALPWNTSTCRPASLNGATLSLSASKWAFFASINAHRTSRGGLNSRCLLARSNATTGEPLTTHRRRRPCTDPGRRSRL